MKALVTGATGFVGSHLTRLLIESGYGARALYRSEKKLEVLAGLDVEAIAGDLDDIALLESACAGCDVVFHVAAKADYWKDDDRDALWRVNVEGTRNLLTAAQSAGVRRVIFTSSASTIGIRPGTAAADESDAFNLAPERFLYAFSKVKAEAIAAEFVAKGLDIVTLNPTVIIGPGDLNAISGSFILEMARFQWLTPVSSGGLAVIDVRDVARAHLAAVERGGRGERYILNCANLSYREWFGLIATACDVTPPVFAMSDSCWSRRRASLSCCARWAYKRQWTPIRRGWAAPTSTLMAERRGANSALPKSTSRAVCAIPTIGTSAWATSSAIG